MNKVPDLKNFSIEVKRSTSAVNSFRPRVVQRKQELL